MQLLALFLILCISAATSSAKVVPRQACINDEECRAYCILLNHSGGYCDDGNQCACTDYSSVQISCVNDESCRAYCILHGHSGGYCGDGDECSCTDN